MLNLDKNKKYLLACSYGPDSMALFKMLLNEGYNFAVAHVNYHFRKESNQEEKDLRKYAKKNNVEIYVYDNKEIVNKNLEARAREIRYSFFEKIYQEKGFDALLVAHHQDDVLETYIMQKNRKLHPFCFGINSFSYSFNMIIMRPLLNYSKEELLTYCKNNNVPYAIDKTNLELIHDRNKVRHQIVKKLSNKKRQELLQEIDDNNELIGNILNKIKALDLHTCKTYSLLSDLERIYAIQFIANECQIFKISLANLKEIMKIISSSKANIILSYKDYSFIKEYDHIYFISSVDSFDYSYTIDRPSLLDTPYFYLDFTQGANDRNVKDDDYPLTIRTAHPHDQVCIKDYVKDVRRLFIDWKMPITLRKRWPVILNKNNKVIYIPRYQKEFVASKNCNFYVK